MISTIAKFVHRTSDAVPGLRMRIWREYICDPSSFRPCLNAEVQPVRIDRSQLALLKTIKPIIENPEGMATRLDNGNDCWIVQMDGVPMWSVWSLANSSAAPLAPQARARAPRQFVLPPRSVYLWDSWCSEGYRRRGINRQAASAIITGYFAKGFGSVFSLIAPFNTPSIASRVVLGFQPGRLMLEFSLGRRVAG